MKTFPLKNDKGFTLIELLIVIAIIGLLVTVTIIIINPAKHIKEASDAKRINEMLVLQTALNSSIISEHINLTICDDCNSRNGTAAIDGTGWIQFDSISGKGMGAFLARLPFDTLNTGENVYSYYSDGVNYELNAKFESQKYSGMAELDGGNDSAVYERGTNLLLK